jgi:hypothetical protein
MVDRRSVPRVSHSELVWMDLRVLACFGGREPGAVRADRTVTAILGTTPVRPFCEEPIDARRDTRGLCRDARQGQA